MSDRATSSANSSRLVYILTFSAIFIIGYLEASRTVILPIIRDNLNLSYSRIGAITALSSCGFLLSFFVSGLFGDKVGPRLIMVISLVALTVVLLVMRLATSFFSVILIFFFLRCANGSGDLGVNLAGGYWFGKNAALKLNVLHFFFGAGATIAPYLITLLLEKSLIWHQTYLLVAPIALLSLLLWRFAPLPLIQRESIKGAPTFRELLRSRSLWLVIVLLTGALISEVSFGDWIKIFLIEQRQFGEIASGQMLSIFFLLFTISRLIAGFVINRIGVAMTIIICGALSLGCFIAALLIPRLVFLFPVIGLFISPLFPIAILMLTRQFGRSSGSAMGVSLLVSGLLQALFNGSVGVVQDIVGANAGFGIISVGFIAPVIVGLILFNQQNMQKNDSGAIDAPQ